MIRVLHVEPDGDLRGLIKQRFQELNSELHLEQIMNSVEAITICTNEQFDCILIGHSQILDSIELSITLRGVSRAPQIIYSVEDSENITSRAFDVGVDAYLVIQRSLDQAPTLTRRIKEIVEKRRSDDIALAIANAEEVAVVVESGDKIIYASPPFERLVSREHSEIIGKSLTSFTIISDRTSVQTTLQKGGETGLTILRPDGVQRKCRIRVSQTQMLGKDASVVVVFINDVTETQGRENRLRSLHSQAPEILLARNLDELARRTLDAVEASFDSEVLSFMVVEGDELVCVERRWRARGLRMPLSSSNSMARAVREGKPVGVGDFLKEPTLLEETAQRSGLSIPVKSGEGVVAVIDLRSSRKEAFSDADIDTLSLLSRYVGCVHKLLDDLRVAASSETQYRRLLETLNDAVFVLDDSRYIFVNKRGADLLGYSDPSEIIGTDVYQHVAPEFRELVRDRVQGLLKGEEVPSRYEIKLLKRDGSTIDIEVDASRIYFEGKPASLAIEKDVTSLKETQEQIKRHTVDLEQQVENRTQELLEAQQFAAAGRMASMVGHDLRSPLQSIKNASYLMRRQPERSDDMLNSIDSSVDRALAMLEELRHQTRETPLKLESTDLPGMITDIIKQTPMEENVAVDMRLEPTLKIVQIDPLKVRRILENLVRNALEAMPNGGRLTVETKDDGNYFTILVTDTGVGIPRERLPNLFRPFYTTKSKGLGLGLAYSQKAAEVHGGTIEVESEVGKGTTFKVRLPHRTPSNMSESMK
jgi:two-component system sporulation sensor kinase A